MTFYHPSPNNSAVSLQYGVSEEQRGPRVAFSCILGGAKREQLVNREDVLRPMVRGRVCEDSCCGVKQVLTSFGSMQHKVC